MSAPAKASRPLRPDADLASRKVSVVTELPGLHLAGDIVWKTQMIVRGPRSMPIGW